MRRRSVELSMKRIIAGDLLEQLVEAYGALDEGTSSDLDARRTLARLEARAILALKYVLEDVMTGGDRYKVQQRKEARLAIACARESE